MNKGRELSFSACFKSKDTQKAIATTDGINGLMVFKNTKTKITGKTMVEMSLDKANKIVYWVR